MDQCALLMMKDLEPQLWQANSFCGITRRRHHARSPDAYMRAHCHAVYLCAFRYVHPAVYRHDGPNFLDPRLGEVQII